MQGKKPKKKECKEKNKKKEKNLLNSPLKIPHQKQPQR